MFDKARAYRKSHPRRRSPHLEQYPLFDPKGALVQVRSTFSLYWPVVQQRVGPYLKKGKEKLADLYASGAQVLAAQKEAFDDRRAERKNRQTPPPETKKRKTRPKAAKAKTASPS